MLRMKVTVSFPCRSLLSLCACLLFASAIPLTTAAEARPTVGLALGGGGAKGFAHVGVLRALEEMRVPIDYVSGTSMGAIIGGLYAAGMSPDDIEDMLVSADWWDLLEDGTPRRDLEYRRKIDYGRYFMNLEWGWNDWTLSTPSAFSSGQKLNNLLQAKTVHVAGNKHFDELKIPFRAVATDIKTGQPVVLEKGSLGQAMRASMAVPGAFSPVVIDGHRLVDGGVVMNLPTEVTRGMGADIVIAVNVTDAASAMATQRLDSAVALLVQSYLIMTQDHEKRAMAAADIALVPDTSAVSAAAFHEGYRLFDEGAKVVEAEAERMGAYSIPEEEYKLWRDRQRARGPLIGQLSAVTVAENQRVDERSIRHRIRSRPGDAFDMPEMNRDLRRIYGMGDFERVIFTLSGEAAGPELTYHTGEKPWGPGYLRPGARLETDFENHTSWALLLNYTRTRVNRLGAEWRNDLVIGEESRLHTELYQPLDYGSRFFVAGQALYQRDLQDLYEGDDPIVELVVTRVWGSLDAGIQFGRYGAMRIGFGGGDIRVREDIGTTDLPDDEDVVVGVPAQIVIDRLDDPWFPRHGLLLRANGMVVRESLGSDRDYEWVGGDYLQAFSVGKHTVTLGAAGGSSLGSDLPFYAQFTLGGVDSFSGLSVDQLRGSYMASGRLGYRYEILRLPPGMGQGVYLTSWGDAGNVWAERDDVSADDLIYGGSIGLGVNAITGPIMLAYGRTDEGSDRVYFSMGARF